MKRVKLVQLVGQEVLSRVENDNDWIYSFTREKEAMTALRAELEMIAWMKEYNNNDSNRIS